jgi:FeS assembly SUF system protein
MPNKNQVLSALKKVYDPEIPINLVDLGLIYDVLLEDTAVRVKMTLTAPGCPMHTVIAKNVKDAVNALDGVENCEVEFVWEPRWTPDMISTAGRLAMGME